MISYALAAMVATISAGLPASESANKDVAATKLDQIAAPAGEMITSIGQTLDLEKAAGRKGTVLIFISTECPLSNGYLPTVNRLAKEYADKGIEFIGVDPNEGQPFKKIEQHRIRYGITIPVVRDPSAHLATSLGITHCPEVIVFNSAKKAVYRGRIDDRYPRRGGAPKQVFHVHDLEDVLTKLSKDQAVDPYVTEAIGCPIVMASHASSTPDSSSVNFTRDVAVVLKKHCQECHRDGGIGPFSLTNYDDAVLWKDDLVTFTENKSMPPWKLVEGHGDFQNARRMTDQEIGIISSWVKAGCPKGNDSDMPEPLKVVEGWKLGKPDVVLQMLEPYELAAEGPDEYRHFVIPTNFDKDVYINAIEINAGNPRVDHHVIVFLDPHGVSEKLDAADPSPGYITSGGFPGFVATGMLGGWAPGNVSTPLPPGAVRIIPKGSRIVLQMHYHKSGKTEIDQTKVGLYLAKEEPKRLVRDIAITPPEAVPMLQNVPFLASKIPANAANFTVGETMYVPEDIEIISARPHMHLIGKELKVTATLPDGTKKELVYIKNWDFNWQENYYYTKPVFLPKDTKLELTAVFDNSADNPANPNMPPKPVAWGEGTTDEMAFCFFELVPTKDATSKKELEHAAVTSFLKRWIGYQLNGPHGKLSKFLPPKGSKG
ncbi:redoxin family protein [bacterium]|nr:redoxin family protein [bacterium]